MMSPEQCRAARAWLNWSQPELASAAGVGVSTVKDYENGKRKPIVATLAAMKAALEKAGIAFVEGGNGLAWGITFATPTGKAS